MATPILTQMRREFWRAIGAYPDLLEEFKAVWKFDRSDETKPIPAIGQMPALVVDIRSASTGWVLNQEHEMTLPLALTIYTAGYEVVTMERLFEGIVKAAYTMAPPYRASGAVQIVTSLITNPVECRRWDVTLPIAGVLWNPSMGA